MRVLCKPFGLRIKIYGIPHPGWRPARRGTDPGLNYSARSGRNTLILKHCRKLQSCIRQVSYLNAYGAAPPLTPRDRVRASRSLIRGSGKKNHRVVFFLTCPALNSLYYCRLWQTTISPRTRSAQESRAIPAQRSEPLRPIASD